MQFTPNDMLVKHPSTGLVRVIPVEEFKVAFIAEDAISNAPTQLHERNELFAYLEMLTFACEKYAEERAAHRRACDSHPERQFAFLKERMWECRHLLSRLNKQGGAS